MRKRKEILFTSISVIDAGAKGKSVAKAPDGRVIFLQNAIPGDVVDIKILKKKKAYYEGQAIYFHQYSKDRITPKCNHFGVCGGCKWQDMSYPKQLEFKQNEVYNHLKRIGGVALPEGYPIVGSSKTYGYRNKMEFSFSNARWLSFEEIQSEKTIEDRDALGFHIPGMWDKILDLTECHLQADPSNPIRLRVKQLAKKHQLSFFSPKNQQGNLRTLMIRTTNTGEVMLVFQFYEDHAEKRMAFFDDLLKEFKEITSLQYVINPKKNDTLYDQTLHLYSGQGYITEQMENLKFRITPKSFYQTNSEQAYTLYKITRDFADLSGNELVYDLYTGTGTIAQFVAQFAKKVIGIESVPEAITDARANALNNGITNVSFFVGDMKNVFNDDFLTINGYPDVIITDPPRDGMHKDVVNQILKIGAKKVVYVSCNSATQARDLALMNEKYRVTKYQPVDMFPQTHHVENVVLLEHR